MIFVESQSSWSINILIRILLYLADTIQEYLYSGNKDIHDYKKLEIPKPEFYVIYTGRTKVPEQISLREDFFGSVDCPIDLKAIVYTAETDDIIGQYIIFCRVLDDQIQKLGRTREAAEEAIRICQDRGVLSEYLKDREKEVVDIMIMLFDQEYAVKQYGRTQKEEGRVEGLEEGRILERIDIYREAGMDDQSIIAALRKKFGLTQEKAESYVLSPVSA